MPSPGILLPGLRLRRTPSRLWRGGSRCKFTHRVRLAYVLMADVSPFKLCARCRRSVPDLKTELHQRRPLQYSPAPAGSAPSSPGSSTGRTGTSAATPGPSRRGRCGWTPSEGARRCRERRGQCRAASSSAGGSVQPPQKRSTAMLDMMIIPRCIPRRKTAQTACRCIPRNTRPRARSPLRAGRRAPGWSPTRRDHEHEVGDELREQNIPCRNCCCVHLGQVQRADKIITPTRLNPIAYTS